MGGRWAALSDWAGSRAPSVLAVSPGVSQKRGREEKANLGGRPSWGSVTWLKGPLKGPRQSHQRAPESRQPRLNGDEGWITQPEAELFLGERFLPTHVPGRTRGGQNRSRRSVFSKFSVAQGCQPRPLQASPPPTPPSRGPGICGACKTACLPGMTPFTSRWRWSGAASASTPDSATGRFRPADDSRVAARRPRSSGCVASFSGQISHPGSSVSRLARLSRSCRAVVACSAAKGKLKRVL